MAILFVEKFNDDIVESEKSVYIVYKPIIYSNMKTSKWDITILITKTAWPVSTC
jgi:hypothetical protein